MNLEEFREPMRNFNDEAFLLFFANEYPEAFNEVAHEFVDLKGIGAALKKGGRKALEKTADVAGPHIVRGLSTLAAPSRHVKTLVTRPAQYAQHVGETLGQGAKKVIQGVGHTARGIGQGLSMAGRGVVEGGRGFIHGKQRTHPDDQVESILGGAKQRLGGEETARDYSDADKREIKKNPEAKGYLSKHRVIREHGKHKSSEFGDYRLQEFKARRKVAVGKKMMQFMLFNAGIANGGEIELRNRMKAAGLEKDIPPSVTEKFSV